MTWIRIQIFFSMCGSRIRILIKIKWIPSTGLRAYRNIKIIWQAFFKSVCKDFLITIAKKTPNIA